jgi:hypothetical protein
MNRFAALCMLTVLLTGIGHAQTTGATHSAACTNPEYRQLDFWLGDWNVYEVSDSARAVARNRVHPHPGWVCSAGALPAAERHGGERATAFGTLRDKSGTRAGSPIGERCSCWMATWTVTGWF